MTSRARRIGLIALASLLVGACSFSVGAYAFAVPARGQILFGPQFGSVADSIANAGTSFPMEGHIAFSAQLSATVSGQVTVDAALSDGSPKVLTTQLVDAGTRYIYGTLDLTNGWVPGTYRFRVLNGTSILAMGTLTLTS